MPRPSDTPYQRVLDLAAGDRESGRDDDAELLEQAVRGAPPPRSLPRRVAGRVARPALEGLVQGPRILKYELLSTCPRLSGRPRRAATGLFAPPGGGRR